MMYTTKIDVLGRITIQADIMEQLGLKARDELEMRLTKQGIVLYPYTPRCAICGEKSIFDIIGDTNLCKSCVVAIANDELADDWNKKFRPFTRTIDELRRFVLPMEYRKAHNIESNTEVYIYVLNGGIYIVPTQDGCFTCGSTENIKQVGSYKFCEDCMSKIVRASKG